MTNQKKIPEITFQAEMTNYQAAQLKFTIEEIVEYVNKKKSLKSIKDRSPTLLKFIEIEMELQRVNGELYRLLIEKDKR